MTLATREEITQQLLELSHWLGAPAQNCAILGEGNTSAWVDEHSFVVKASGCELRTLAPQQLVQVNHAQAMAILDAPSLADERLAELLADAKVDSALPVVPSIETMLHAVCLAQPGVRFVGHCHPTSVNALACSTEYEPAVRMRLFPDHVTICGAESLVLPYADVGFALGKLVQQGLADFAKQHGHPPRTVYLQNHGLIALGKTAKQVQALTAMSDKAARILLGSYACGGPNPMPREAIRRIDSRADEHYRQRMIEGTSP